MPIGRKFITDKSLLHQTNRERINFLGKVYILLEYAQNGCLESYLRKRRPGGASGVEKLDGRYTNLNKNKSDAKIREGDLIRWSYQVAKGMEFLVSKSV